MIATCRIPAESPQDVRHQHHGTIRLLGADTAQRTKRNLTTAQIKTGSRLVQNQQIRISHQRTADQHARYARLPKV